MTLHRLSQRLGFERRLSILAIGTATPALALGLGLLWRSDLGLGARWGLTGAAVLCTVGLAFVLRRRAIYPLRTASSLVEALRLEDYSMRGRFEAADDALGDLVREINLLSETLAEKRLSALEATALLRKVMAEIDVAIFAFDPERRLRLVNRAGETLLARPASRLEGRSARDLGLADWLEGEPPDTVEHTFPGAVGRWGIRRSTFRQEGLEHDLLVISDLSRTLRQEERQAWQRLIRVLGHELNNSLGPIQSTAETLERLVARQGEREGWDEAEWRHDLDRGLAVIRQRSKALAEFVASYSKIARLPEPSLAPVAIAPIVAHATQLEARLPIEVEAGPELVVLADRSQIEQALINLLKNAVDAALETDGGVRVTWRKRARSCELLIDDEGPGLPASANVFTPFFSTKPDGSGIGLLLCRQIVEAHGGGLTLENRADALGCRARLRLPLADT
ncbi:MAG: ATP-binding protein [Thermoanaerobaculia bacterium]|nr:ATP-binding protein [Thermoanaerobaculia bacterium]